jgi:hypothetical protein
LGEHVIARRAPTATARSSSTRWSGATPRRVALWRSLGFEVLATVPEGFDHPVAGPVALHIMHRRL